MAKQFRFLLIGFAMILSMPAFAAVTFSCGDGYVLAKHSKIDGLTTKECKKLWCRDLENGQSMGSGNNAASGYRMTDAPILLKDKDGPDAHSIMCFGDRKWCSGEVEGIWNPEYGAYTRGGADSSTYQSFQKGGCFAWRLEKPSCEEGMSAILENDEWVCVTTTKSDANRASSIRRTGAIRRR